MTSWEEFARLRASKELFLRRIYKLGDFYHACENSSFLAVCIKDVEKSCKSDRVLLQVGLAYLPSLEPDEVSRCGFANMSTLIQFHSKKKVQALTLNVHVPQDELDHILTLHDVPVRRNLRFGQQQMIFPEMLNAAVAGFLDRCLHNNTRNLIMIGYGSSGWRSMRDYFPEAMPYFSTYMDIRDLLRDAAPNSGSIPQMTHCLELFGFDGELQHEEKFGTKADNAGEHAVAVCALAHLLLSPENQQRFEYRLECGLMARRWERTEARKVFTSDAQFMLSVRTKAREALPYALNSSWKMAKEFYKFSPKFAVRMSHIEGYVQFHNETDMQQFIDDVNGRVYPTGEMLDIQSHLEVQNEVQQQEQHQREWGQQEENHQHACGQQEEEQQNYWDQQEAWTQSQEWDCQEKESQQQEDHQQEWGQQEESQEEYRWNSAGEGWPTGEDWPTGEEKEEDDEEEEEEEEEEDGEMPELVEIDPAADWDLVSN